jgi:hypothetical protein
VTDRSFTPEPDPAPIRGESLDGFIARHAAAEGYPNTLELTSLAGVRWAHRPVVGLASPEELAAVADCTGVDHDGLVLRSSPYVSDARRRFFDVELDHRFFAHGRRLFSPASLADSPHHRALWALRPFPFCELSWELLQDRCPDPACRTTQRWHHAMGVDRCDLCVEPLTGFAAPHVPDALRSQLRLLIGLVHPERARRDESRERLPEPLSAMSAGDLLDLACALAGVHDPSIRQSSNRRLLADGATPAAVNEAMAAAWTLLEGWPAAFENLAADRIATRAGRHGDGNRGATEVFLALADGRSSTAEVRGLIGGLRAGLTRSGRGSDVKCAARHVGLKVTELARLRRAGLIRTIFSIDDDRPLPLLCACDLDELATAVRTSSSFTKTAVRLGTAYRGVEELVSSGWLEAVDHPALAFLGREGRVTTASIDALCTAVADRSDAIMEGVPLRRAMIGLPGLKPWAAVLDGVALGRLRIRFDPASATLVGGIVLHPDHVERLQGFCTASPPNDTAFADMMSKQDALEALGLHQRHGTSVLTEWRAVHGLERTIPVHIVEQLARKAISPSEAAARFGVRPLAMVNHFRRHAVPELPGGMFDRGRAEEALRKHSAPGSVRRRN